MPEKEKMLPEGIMNTEDKMTIDERWKYLRIIGERYREADRKGRAEMPKVRPWVERNGTDDRDASEERDSTPERASESEEASSSARSDLRARG